MGQFSIQQGVAGPSSTNTLRPETSINTISVLSSLSLTGQLLASQASFTNNLSVGGTAAIGSTTPAATIALTIK